MTKTFATAISLFAFLSIAQGKPSRRLQESPTCDIIGFSLYNGEYVTSLYYTLDLNDYPNGKINIARASSHLSLAQQHFGEWLPTRYTVTSTVASLLAAQAG